MLLNKPNPFTTNTIDTKPRPRMFAITKAVIKENKTVKKDAEKKDAFSFWKWFKNRCLHYCSVTALHGYNHLVRKDFALWEK